jgi:hypothetical protein
MADEKSTHKPTAWTVEAKFEGAGNLSATVMRNPRIVDDTSDIAKGRQIMRVRRVLPKLYPPSGNAPDDLSTETVRQQVSIELGRETKELGLTGNDKPADPSWDTVNRALRRSK